MKTFHEWLAEREQRQRVGLWLNDKNAVIGLSKLNPLPRSFGGEQELKQKAEATAVRRAAVQTVPGLLNRLSCDHSNRHSLPKP